MPDADFRSNLNLLPAAYRRRVLVRAGLTLWASVAAVGLSLAGVVLWYAERALASVEEELSRFERVYAPTQMMAGELESMRKRLVTLDSEEKAAADLEDDRPTLALLGIISHAARECDGRLHVRDCHLQRETSDGTGNQTERQLLTLRGAALEVLDVTKFLGLLSDSGMFAGVDSKPITNEQIGSQTGHSFHIECAF
jgi:hypothetical protein